MSRLTPPSRSMPQRILLTLLALILGLITGFSVFCYQVLKLLPYVPIPELDPQTGRVQQSPSMLQRAQKMGVYVSPEDPLVLKPQKEADYVHILIYGLDSRGPEDQDAGRSDAMLVLTLDRRKYRLCLSSLLRDSRVAYAGGTNEGKLNAAYVYGGVGLLMNTVNETLDLDLRHYIQFSWDTTEKMVDAMGGVNIEISPEELAAVNENIPEQARVSGTNPNPHFLKKAGLQRLNGMQALAWVRVRKVGNDQGRTSRQRKLMEAMLLQFRQTPALKRLGIIRRALSLLVTNIEASDLLSWAVKGHLRSYPVTQYRVPEDGLYYASAETGWDLVIDWEAQRKAFWNFIHGGGEH